MEVTEHDLNGEATLTPFVQQMLDHIGNVCREYRDDDDEQSTFVFPHMKQQLIIFHGEQVYFVAGAYIIAAPETEKHHLILVTDGGDGEATMFTPSDGETWSAVLGELEVFYIKPHHVGYITMLVEPPLT